jgi:hypothetical protein
MWGKVLPLFSDSFGGYKDEVCFSPLSLVLWAMCYKQEIWRGLIKWLFVSSTLFLLSTERVTFGTCSSSLPFVQDSAICCFCQAAAALPYCCNSGWSAPMPARWGNSILYTALSPSRLTQWSSMLPLWEFGLSPHSHSQPLFLAQPPLAEISAPLGCWHVGMLSHPCSHHLFLAHPLLTES